MEFINNIGGINYSFADYSLDTDLLEQYFKLRKEVFVSYWNLKNFVGENEFDRKGHILLLHKDGICYGGARINLCTPLKDDLLPLESEELRLKDVLNIDLKTTSYVEASKIVLVPELMNCIYANEMYRIVIEKSRQLGAAYLFAKAPLKQARRSKMACRHLNLITEIVEDLDLPDDGTHDGIKMVLSIFFLDLSYHTTDLVKQKKGALASRKMVIDNITENILEEA